MEKDLKELYNACMSGNKDVKLNINPSMVLTCIVSPFNLWCDFFAPVEEKDPKPESLKILAQIGNIEEEKYVAEKYPGMQPIKIETIEQAFFEVLRGCFEGAEPPLYPSPLIYLPENLMGIPDVLVKRTSHGSIFGGHHYIVNEKKIVKEIREEHIFQTALNNYILGKIQGYTPPKFVILNRDNEEFEFSFEDYEKNLSQIIEEIKMIRGGKSITPTKGSLKPPWESFGLKKAKELGDISLISGVGPVKKELLSKIGIRTIYDLYNAHISVLGIKGVGDKTASEWKLQATSMVENKKIVTDKPQFKKFDTEIFLDLEGTFDVSNLFLADFGVKSEERWFNIIYLIGALVAESDGREYIPFFADSIDKEKDIVDGFVNFLKSKNNFVIYHYGSYDHSKIKELLEKYNTKDFFTDKMIDLQKILKNSVKFPVHSYGLKEIAKNLGFKWSEQGMDGFISVAHYLNYLKNKDKAEKEKVIKYNEEDCRATMVVRDFLCAL